MSNILYLLNHKTLTDFEVPILIKNKLYPFITKKYQSLDSVNSINYNSLYFYDNFVDIPINIIKYLNSLDWFSKKFEIDRELMSVINKYFKFIFLTLLTPDKILEKLINNYNGIIYFRFFGMEKKKSYFNTMKHIYKKVDIYSSKIRCIFSYKNIITYENSLSNYFINRSYYIPLGLSNNFFSKYSNIYNPINNSIIFVCSRTDEGMNGYYGKIYNKFINNFKDYSFTILGKNNDKIAHLKYIRNNLSNDDFYKTIAQHKCMYYHSDEERHLHYHPLEAFVIGTPVVFSRKSQLTSYINDSPAIYDNIEQAKDIINKILSDDKDLIKIIIDKQNKIVNQLSINHNLNIFKKILS